MEIIKFINTGSTRLVFLVGKYAIKTPRCCIKPDNKFYGKLMGFLQGWIGNRSEYIWSKSKIYPFLNPVRLSLFGSLIIVMDRADIISDDEFLLLNKNDFDFYGFEFKADSFGKVNNTIKVIDYGS